MSDQVLKDPMEYIWDRIPKDKNGNVQYLFGDIPYLYVHGFVDNTRFTYQEWKKTFEQFKQPNGTYLVNKSQFMSLKIFRYEGPTFEPFDPQRIREGKWTDEDLAKLYELSIKPSSSVKEEVFWGSINALKNQGLKDDNNQLIVDKRVKTQLSYLIERFPSARRRLEKEVSRIRKDREQQYQDAVNKRDASNFTSGQFDSEIKVKDFKNLESKASQSTLPQAQPKEESAQEQLDIKSLRRPTGKING